MPSPKISVVVSCYNKGRTIRGCVTSILHQSTDRIETIVVDDGSTDSSPQILEALRASSSLTILNEKHSGISSTKNKGFSVSKGEIVLFIDGDCVLEDGSLVELAKSFGQSAVDCVGGEVRATNAFCLVAKAVEIMQNEVERKWPFGANVAYSRKALEAGLFDEKMTAGEDAELYLRVTKLGFRSIINRRIVARTQNPCNLISFFRQRLNWGRGFRQLTERHPETFTRKIRLCFFWIGAMLLSPLLALVDMRLVWVFSALLVYNLVRFTPGVLPLYRRTGDILHCSFVPLLRLVNALAYLLGWSHWCLLEFASRTERLKPFIGSSTVRSFTEEDSPI